MDKKYFSIEEIKRKLERYCVYQDRCHKEIETKLKEFTLIEEAKNQIVLHLLEHNFLNEERFAKSFARGKFNIKNWGKQRIIRELKFRDISEYKITTKRNELINESDFYKRKKKLSDFLIRKGYEFDLIFETIKNVLEKK